MPRFYSVRLVALALECDRKWIDNLLSHYPLPGISGGRQGVERRIGDDGLLAIEAARIFVTELGLPLGQSVKFATRIVADRSGGEGVIMTPSGLSLSLPIASLEARLRHRVLAAVEALARVVRGRPPSRRSGQT